MVLIPKNPLSGKDNLKYESPWITPESTKRLDHLMRKTDQVIEFGCGGSTLFFARRAQRVLSFESNSSWLKKVEEAIQTKGIDNSQIVYYNTSSELGLVIPKMKDSFDIMLIDSAWAICNRDAILDFCSQSLEPPRVLILDNYWSKKGCPVSWNFTDQEFKKAYPIVEKHQVETYDYEGWGGKGTRMYIDPIL